MKIYLVIRDILHEQQDVVLAVFTKEKADALAKVLKENQENHMIDYKVQQVEINTVPKEYIVFVEEDKILEPYMKKE